MNIFVASGGLGNQLFQISAAINFSLKYKQPVYIDNITYYSKAQFSFECADLKKELEEKKIYLLTNTSIFLRFFFYLGFIKLLNKIQKIINIKIIHFLDYIVSLTIEKKPYKYQILYKKKSLINIYIGSWQSEKHFFWCRNEIKKMLRKHFESLNKNLIKNKIKVSKSKKKVAIHYRLGDYKNTRGYAVLNDDYYLKAIKYIEHNLRDFELIAFSDEIENIKNNKNYSYIDKYFHDKRQKPMQILAGMASCDHFIIANSTLSWWASYLSKAKNKIVIYPSDWLPFINSNLSLPLDHWVKIKNSYKKSYSIYFLLPNFNIVGAQRTSIDFGKKLIEKNYDVKWISGELGKLSSEIDKKKIIIYGLKIKFFSKIKFLLGLINLLFILKKIKSCTLISVTPFLNRYVCFLKLMRIIQCNLILEDHAIPHISDKDEFTNFFTRTFYKKTAWLYNYSSLLRVLSPETKTYYAKILDKKKIIYFPNLINLKRILNLSKEKKFIQQKEKKRIVYLGRFSTQKNHKFLIKTFSKMSNKDFKVFFIGEGPLESELRFLVQNLSLKKRIFFLKNTKYNYSILKTSDLFPMVSLWEGMPITMCEAMLLGIPIVSQNFFTGPKFYLGKNSQRGFLVLKKDITSFARKLDYVLSNPRKANERVIKAKSFILKKMNIDTNIDNYINKFLNF